MRVLQSIHRVFTSIIFPASPVLSNQVSTIKIFPCSHPGNVDSGCYECSKRFECVTVGPPVITTCNGSYYSCSGSYTSSGCSWSDS